MPRRPRIVVIGAGIIGTSIAWRLAARGASVTIVEAALPGAGTTGTSLSWVNASSKLDSTREHFDLAVRATAEHHALADAAGETRFFYPTGNIEISRESADADRLRSKVARLQKRGYPADLVSVQELEHLEPGLKLPATAVAAYYADEGWIDGPAMARVLLERARSSGAEVLVQGAAKELVLTNGGVAGVAMARAHREVVPADTVIVATGRWTQDFLAPLGVDVPLAQVESKDSKAVGLLVSVGPTAGRPRTVLHSPEVNWAPRPTGAVLASARADRVVARDRSPETVKAMATALLQRAADLSARLAGARFEHTEIGLRALPIDGRPVCGWIESIDGLYVAVTHSGITLAPLLSRLVAEEIVDGVEVSALSTFRPSRFDSGAGRPDPSPSGRSCGQTRR